MASLGDLEIDDAFSRSYEVEWLVDMPNSSLPCHFVPDGIPNGGPVLQVTTVDGTYHIVVPGGAIGLRVHSWPSDECFFVSPSGVLVNTVEPERSHIVRGFEGHGVHFVFSVPARNVVLVGHCCGIYCYGRDGLIWLDEDLFCCADPTLDMAAGVLLVTANKHGEDPRDTPILKRLNLLSGERLM